MCVVAVTGDCEHLTFLRRVELQTFVPLQISTLPRSREVLLGHRVSLSVGLVASLLQSTQVSLVKDLILSLV